MNTKDISTQLLFSTAPIVCETDESISTGTAFFFSYGLEDGSNVPLLITSKHVVENAKRGYFEINLAKDGMPQSESLRVNFSVGFFSSNGLEELDIAVAPIAPALSFMEKNGKAAFYRSVDKGLIPSKKNMSDLAALEEITFIGYPSGLYDEKNKTPLIRRGITATPIWNDYQGEKAFLIDASVFPGSSGSPVFIFNQGSYSTGDGIVIGSRLYFVGVVSQTIVRNGKEYLDLGKVIRSDAISEGLKDYVSGLLDRSRAE